MAQIVVVEITDTHIKFLQMVPHDKRPLVHQSSILEIHGYSEPEISKAIASWLASVKSRQEPLIAIIPRRFIIQRHISLPSHDDHEIKKMVGLQITKQVPYPKDDIIIDYVVLNKDPAGYSKVLVIAVHKEVVGRFLKIFSDAGRHPRMLTLSSEGLLNWVSHWTRKDAQAASGTTVVINIDFAHAEVCFVTGPKLAFSRSLNFGARELDPDHVHAWLEQFHLTVNAFNQEKISQGITRIVLVTLLEQAALLRTHLAGEYKIPVELYNPYNEIELRKDFSLPPLAVQGKVSLSVGLGFGLTGRRRLINLLPPEVSDTRATQSKQRHWIKLGVLSAVCLGLLIATSSLATYRKGKYVKELAEVVKDTERAVDDLQSKSERLDLLKQRSVSQIPIAQIFTELYRLTPSGVSYRTISLDEKRTLVLQGATENSSDINNLQKSLLNSPNFNNVNLQYATKRKMFRGVEVTDFKMTCQVARKQK